VSAAESGAEWELRYIEPGTPEYAQAAELRYEMLYAHLGLPRSLIEDSDGRRYVHIAAFEDERVVGYARIHLEGGDSQVYQVCVGEDRRGLGMASALMRELASLAVRKGRTEISLHARTHAIGFYEKLGFAAEGEEFLSPRTGTPHRVMRRPLAVDDVRLG